MLSEKRPNEIWQIDQKEIKLLASEFAQVFERHYEKTKDMDMIGKQMLTALAALQLTAQIVREEASRLGFEIRMEVMTLPDPPVALQ